MIEGHASRTARYVALFRALEDGRPRAERLFADPFARLFLDPRLTLAVSTAQLPLVGSVVPWFIDRRYPGSRTAAVARTRFIDDRLHAALGGGLEQLVILGAGLDSRAYRLSGIEACRVFEVDHPATFAKKREAVVRALGNIPKHVTYVPTDFNEQRIADVMEQAGFEPGRRTFIIWEGVTNYLTEAAVDVTLRWCGQAAAASEVVFTYVHRRVLDDPRSFHGTEKLFAMLDDAGEKWTFGLDPAALEAFVATRGLALEQDIGATDYRALYYGRAAEKMTGYEFYRIAACRVAG